MKTTSVFLLACVLSNNCATHSGVMDKKLVDVRACSCGGWGRKLVYSSENLKQNYVFNTFCKAGPASIFLGIRIRFRVNLGTLLSKLAIIM